MTDLPTAINKQAADISHQAQNFLRIANLLFRVAITAVRGKFDTEFHPSRLGFVLKTNKLKPLEPLKRKKIINQAQWDLLFPKSGKQFKKKTKKGIHEFINDNTSI